MHIYIHAYISWITKFTSILHSLMRFTLMSLNMFILGCYVSFPIGVVNLKHRVYILSNSPLSSFLVEEGCFSCPFPSLNRIKIPIELHSPLVESCLISFPLKLFLEWSKYLELMVNLSMLLNLDRKCIYFALCPQEKYFSLSPVKTYPFAQGEKKWLSLLRCLSISKELSIWKFSSIIWFSLQRSLMKTSNRQLFLYMRSLFHDLWSLISSCLFPRSLLTPILDSKWQPIF